MTGLIGTPGHDTLLKPDIKAASVVQTLDPVCVDARPDVAVENVTWREQTFRVIRHPPVTSALAEFCSDFEAGTLAFFDAVLPFCDAMIDVGAYVGLMSLYAAARVSRVSAFEASPTNFNLLARNVGVNDTVRDRIQLFRYGLGDRNQHVPLYGKAFADSGSSIFRTIERRGILNGAPEATVELRDAAVVLRDVGLTGRSLLKIDIEGAEYLVVPAIADLLAEKKPFLHVSFHPFNLVSGRDDYTTTVLRLRCALQVAEALAPYQYMYFFEQGRWDRIDAEDRAMFLRRYLLQPKPLPGIATPQYGFIGAVGFSDVALDALDDGQSAAAD